jgi:folate-dependent tRNA-U54 methylase TrmFO/GidA
MREVANLPWLAGVCWGKGHPVLSRWMRIVPEVVLSSGEESTVKTGTAYAIDADPMAAEVVPEDRSNR